MRLLVIDDDVELCSLLRAYFEHWGFPADFEPDGRRGVMRFQSAPYDLMILDVMLPDQDGFQVLRQVRRRSQLPVLMLTAKAEPRDRVQGFDLGADDYLAKPFCPDELRGRLQAILRRASGPQPTPSQPLEIGALRLLPGTRTATYHGRDLGLTAMECEVLEHLMRSGGQVVSRDQLCLHLYSRPQSPYDRSVDTHVSRIRRKIREPQDFILSIRGVGYQLRSPAPEGA